MRIAFFGLPLAGLLLHADGHELVYAALSRPHYPGERRLRRALEARTETGASRPDPSAEGPVAIRPDVDGPELTARLRALAPELIVSWFWTTRLPPSLVAVAPLGGVGVHPSLLPRHRGPDPYFWTLDSGDAITGVTAHEIDSEYDTGAILAQRSIAVDPTWNAWTLAKRLDRPSLALLRETVRAFATGDRPPRRVQDESQATDAPTLGDEELEIDWSWPAERIVRRVRAASPSPGAYTFFGDVSVTLTEVEAVGSGRYPRALAAGEAAVVADEEGKRRAVVRAGDGAVVLVAGLVETEEGDPSPLGTEELIRLVESVPSDEDGS